METIKAGFAAYRRNPARARNRRRASSLSFIILGGNRVADLTQKAKNYATISEKLNTAQEALTVLDSALQFYPNEPH
jgi:hypothetical protein